MPLLVPKRCLFQLAGAARGYAANSFRQTATMRSVSGHQQAVTGEIRQSRAYPNEPRVGVGIVVFREPVTRSEQFPEVLLIRRAKEPAKGQWCFPGGSLELGETITACAAREVLEETGVPISNTPGNTSGHGFSHSLRQPRPLSVVDDMSLDDTGRLNYHYVVVEVAAMAADPRAQLRAGDDVDAVQWMPIDKLRNLQNLWKSQYISKLAEDAWQKYGSNMCHG